MGKRRKIEKFKNWRLHDFIWRFILKYKRLQTLNGFGREKLFAGFGRDSGGHILD